MPLSDWSKFEILRSDWLLPLPLPYSSSGEDLEGGCANFTTASHYPPTSAILGEMIRYQRASKRIPSLIPPGILAIDVPLSNHLIPSEEVCHVCHSSLGDPQEISNKAMIIGLTKVSLGTFSFF